MSPEKIIKQLWERFERSPWQYAAGAVLLVLFSVVLLFVSLSGFLRAQGDATNGVQTAATSTLTVLVPRHLDGVLVPQGQEAFAPRAVMVENEIDARPLSGPAKANMVIESPVEGGITRFLLFFDATDTPSEVGPVRSVRPYFIDWAIGWQAAGFFHIGGSPEALNKLTAIGSNFNNVDEIHAGKYFWRDSDRFAPHNAYTSHDLMERALADFGDASTVAPAAWHFQDAATSTDRGNFLTVKIPYGGSYSIMWKYDRDRNVYVRYQNGGRALDKDGTPVESENVVVIKTDAQILDDKGRLRLRTVGSGDAFVYHDGHKYIERWRRGVGEAITFEGTDGTEVLLTRGRTWIEVVTDEKIFGK